jgi:5-methyltetrahydrofolate--homocysteine methyltransferase
MVGVLIDLWALLKKRIAILDGAMGTMLQSSGMDPGQCPEWFGVNHPEILSDIHYQYIQAGADIIQANTFGANRIKLAEYGLADRVEEINGELVRIAARVARGKALVAASIGPTGKILAPIGDSSFEELYQVFSEQVMACEKAGADLISIETMTDIGEMRIALIAAKHHTRLPVIAHMSFDNNGRTIMGTSPLTALIIMESLQPLAVGANCSGGSRELLPIIKEMSQYSQAYISVQPNAGLPLIKDGHTVYPDSPEEMAEYALRFKEAGVNIIGGCCGSTPEHIKAMANAVRGLKPNKRPKVKMLALASRGKHIIINHDYPLSFIGERINPTARKKLAQDITEGKMHMVIEEAKKQVNAGTPILDVNVGVPGIDEALAMKKAVIGIQSAVDVPISIDSTNIAAIEEGLKNFVGKPLINSTSGEEKQLDQILPLAKKYGAAVLGLCLDETGIPDRAEGRLEIAARIWKRARDYGINEENILIDCLVKTAGAEQPLVMETIKALKLVKKELGVATVLGISNVSHGLPARDILNSAYLAMAWAAGLDLPIINPFDTRTMDVLRAAAVLLNRDINCLEYTKRYGAGYVDDLEQRTRPVICQKCNIPELVEDYQKTIHPENRRPDNQTGLTDTAIHDKITKAVLEGDLEGIELLVAEALKTTPAIDIVNKGLIPGIEQAGELYEKKQYFLPQLVMSAETMKKAFSKVKPHLSEEAEKSRGVMVIATVEGDIHDIGKNIVSILLENYGLKVIDLGKDVKAADIIDAAEREKADIVGLSALMTTTMPRMKEVIEGLRLRKMTCKVIVGGAVMTQEYADKIGADAYCEDARKAVHAVKRLLG